MGLGDSVPGISGGTIAVITKIYDQLVFSIRAIDLQACRLLIKGRFSQAWQHINGNFLLILAAGILSGLLVSANTVLFLLENYYAPLMAFFIGMILSSTWLLKNEFSVSSWQNTLALILGLLLAISMGFISQRSTELSLMSVFFSGVVAISAMLLPGLSGAFILLLLGVYEFILTALLEFNLPYILVFMLGCGIGLLAFSRVLSWLLWKHHQLSYGFISGMLLGSVSALWPWQQTILDGSGAAATLQRVNMLPQTYTQQTGDASMLLASMFALVFGVAVVVLLQTVFVTPSSSPSSPSPERLD